jgi:hypothetical protein
METLTFVVVAGALALAGFAFGRWSALAVAFVVWVAIMAFGALNGWFRTDWSLSAAAHIIGAVVESALLFTALTVGVVLRRALRRAR